MAFVDVIDDYTTGATGTLTTAGGEAVNYTIVSGVATRSLGNTDQGAEIQLDGDPKLEISFDVPVSGLSLSFDRGNPGETYFIEINGGIGRSQCPAECGAATGNIRDIQCGQQRRRHPFCDQLWRSLQQREFQ